MTSPIKRPHTAPPMSFSNMVKNQTIQRCSHCDIVIKKAFVEILDADDVDHPVFLCSPLCYKTFTASLTTKIPTAKIQNLVKSEKIIIDHMAKK